MDPDGSSYYPPRAGRGRLSAGTGVRLERLRNRFAHLTRRLPQPPQLGLLSHRDWLLALLLPGYAYGAIGRIRLAWIVVGVWTVALMTLLVFLGNPWVRTWSLGTLASAHTNGIAFVVLRGREREIDAPPVTLTHRIVIPLVLWALAAFFIYWPLDGLITTTVARVIQIEGRRTIINPRVDPEDLKRGDPILYQAEAKTYRFDGARGPLVIRGGWSWAEVIGLPGDEVTFSSSTYRAGTRVRPRLPFMPTSGVVKVPEDTWLAWPSLQATTIELATPEQISEAILDQARVSRAQFAGRPYRRWFFWRQELP